MSNNQITQKYVPQATNGGGSAGRAGRAQRYRRLRRLVELSMIGMGEANMR